METNKEFLRDPFGPFLSGESNGEFSFIDALVDPAGTFRDPQQVARHDGLSYEEKRAILTSWARNEFVIEAAARSWPELKPQSRVDAVLDTLALFDAPAAEEYRSAVQTVRGGTRGRLFRHLRRDRGSGERRVA